MSKDIRQLIKAEARRMHAKLKGEGIDKSHSHCLEILSNLLGFKNWNVLSALIDQDPERIRKLMDEKMESV